MGHRPFLLPDRKKVPPDTIELLNTLDRLESSIRQLAGRWNDGLPGVLRRELHALPALNAATRLLIRANRR